MENDIAIRVCDLSKDYKMFRSNGQRILDFFVPQKGVKVHSALSHISFEVHKGESYAIVGRNGGGKSTLLQLIAGILSPTSGTIEVNGRISALLELGAGFNPEETGYENIFTNAALLGMKQQECMDCLQDIISFAEIGDYLYQPVKTYSSGMLIRLAFAVAINVKADILLVDEALSVGDIFFRQKCYAKMDELKKKGVTILLVSHNMVEVEQFCTRGMLLSHGGMVMEGSGSAVVKGYYQMNSQKTVPDFRNAEAELTPSGSTPRDTIPFSDGFTAYPGNTEKQKFLFYADHPAVEIAWAKVFGMDGYPKSEFYQGEKAVVLAEFRVKNDIAIPVINVVLKNQNNIFIHGKDTMQSGIELPASVKAGTILYYRRDIELNIAEGEYTYEVGISSVSPDVFCRAAFLPPEELSTLLERLSTAGSKEVFLVRRLPEGRPTQFLFHGVCDLPGKTELLQY